MKKVVKLTGIYNVENREEMLEDDNFIETFNILVEDYSFKITRISEHYNKEQEEPNVSISKYYTDSMLFDLYMSLLINAKNNKEAQNYARILFDYIIFEIIGDSFYFHEVDYKIVNY